MSFRDFADLFVAVGVMGMLLGGSMLVFMTFPSSPGAARKASLLSKRDRDTYLRDYKDPKIVFGGPLGIVKGLAIFALACLVLGGLMRGLLLVMP